jgi:HK97 family phage major capsid protein
MEAVEKINTGFEEFKKVNDQKLAEEAAGNLARAKELQGTLDKIGDALTASQKEKAVQEKRLATMNERLEIQEALQDRPGKSVQEKAKDQHLALFLRWVRGGGRDATVYQEYKELSAKTREMKDITIGSNVAGGFAVPEQIGTEVEKLILKFSDIVSEVKNIRVGTSDYKELVSIHGGTSGWIGEGGTHTATGTPNLRERAPTWGVLYAYPQVSEESLEDIFFDVTGWLTGDIADGMAVALSQVIFNGNGSTRPTGMTNATAVTTDDYGSPMRAAAAYEYLPITSPSSPYTNSGVTADSLIDLQYLLRRGYQSNAKFAMNSVTLGHCRKLKDTNGQYLWQPSLQVGQPDSLLGKAVFTWEELGNPKTANAFAVAYGDFRRGYLLCTRSELHVIPDQVTNPGYTRFIVRRRYGGCPLNNDAVKLLKVAVS